MRSGLSSTVRVTPLVGATVVGGRSLQAMAYDIPEIWCEVSSIELERFVREYPRPFEARPALSQRKVNYREWLGPALGERPTNVVAKTWKRGRCTGYQVLSMSTCPGRSFC